MWKRSKTPAMEEALLIQVRVQNMHELADRVEPKSLVETWTSLTDTTAEHVSRMSASVLKSDISDPHGSRILCVGTPANRDARLDVWSRELIAALQAALRSAPIRLVASVAIGSGPCLMDTSRDGNTLVLGDAVSRVATLSLAAPVETDAVMIDASVAHAFSGSRLTTVELPGGTLAHRLDVPLG